MLSIKHFQNAVSRCIHLPIPLCIRRQVAAIFILKNPRFPNHFLNGCYIVLRPSAELPPPPGLLPFIGASSEHGFLPCLCRSALLRPHLPFCLCSRVIGWPSELASQLAATWSSEGTSFVLSIIPTRHVSLMVTNTAVGYVQLTHLVDDEEHLHVLVTGLAVSEAFRRRGFGRAMLLHIIASVPAKEIWVEVQEDNHPARKLYAECGFVGRKKQETLTRRITIRSLP